MDRIPKQNGNFQSQVRYNGMARVDVVFLDEDSAKSVCQSVPDVDVGDTSTDKDIRSIEADENRHVDNGIGIQKYTNRHVDNGIRLQTDANRREDNWIGRQTDTNRHVDNGTSLKTDANKASKDDVEDLKAPTDLYTVLYSNRRDIFWALFVRFFLLSHSLLAVWRVTEAYNQPLFWFLAASSMFLLMETTIVVVSRAGIEYSWWTPCFLFYMCSTLPAIWLLELQLHRDATSGYDNVDNGNFSAAGVTANYTNNYTTVTTPDSIKETPLNLNRLVLNDKLWVIIIEESLVYLLVFSRWLLPRGKVTRSFLADLLLEFLAIASDIMELLAVFDESAVRQNGNLNIIIMAVWSASFVQFIPILAQKKRFRHVRSPKVPCITRCFGDKFVEIVATLISICLQDLPFLVVRLYIVIQIQILTYSLLFSY